ncbi:hypothetical protein PGT21_009378 [Puccinia graminis f. sp. tritici]|uniref:Uncharacterized protein n=1 Tax=Puccinia graminis f. sp. tritici TaxID=56615 RepID=A0A5B0NBK3_PUCGR|nr:hypothetical protein PGT21_009378 [Puccinia graminis f. sp. tritici]
MGYLTDWIPLETALESFKGISDQGEKAIQLIEHYVKLNTENAKSKTKIDFSAILVDLGDNGWEELDRFNSERERSRFEESNLTDEGTTAILDIYFSQEHQLYPGLTGSKYLW